MASHEFEQLRQTLSQLTDVFDEKLERIEKRTEKNHSENVSGINQLIAGYSRMREQMAAIVGDPTTNIDGRLGTMQQNLKETEARLKDEIREVETRFEGRQEKIEAKVDGLSKHVTDKVASLNEQFSNLWKAIAIGAIGVIIDIIWRVVAYMIHK